MTELSSLDASGSAENRMEKESSLNSFAKRNQALKGHIKARN
jgi:hypothetical protein